jgi:hypothetical protein
MVFCFGFVFLAISYFLYIDIDKNIRDEEGFHFVSVSIPVVMIDASSVNLQRSGGTIHSGNGREFPPEGLRLRELSRLLRVLGDLSVAHYVQENLMADIYVHAAGRTYLLHSKSILLIHP